jgi:hypothetical protein
MPQLPSPGSHAFTPQLIRSVLADPSLKGWDFDSSLFTTILLALIVGKGGVIVDVSSDREDGNDASSEKGRGWKGNEGKGKGVDKVGNVVKAVSCRFDVRALWAPI